MTLDELKLVLEQVEGAATAMHEGMHACVCEYAAGGGFFQHAPDCRYVRVKKLLERDIEARESGDGGDEYEEGYADGYDAGERDASGKLSTRELVVAARERENEARTRALDFIMSELHK